jgi:hypothetical protein
MKKLIALILTSVSAIAATATHTFTVFPTLTNWSVTNAIPQWNPADGALNSVTITVAANTASTFYAESLDTIPRNTEAESVFSVFASASTLSVSAGTTNSHAQTLSAHDGVIDYAGTSGFIVGKSASASAANSTTSVASFVGTGTVPVTASAAATATYDGPGDYFFFVQSRASAIVTVTYDFTPNCPPCDDDEEDCRKPRRSPKRCR